MHILSSHVGKYRLIRMQNPDPDLGNDLKGIILSLGQPKTDKNVYENLSATVLALDSWHFVHMNLFPSV